jgi:hypothetical protein
LFFKLPDVQAASLQQSSRVLPWARGFRKSLVLASLQREAGSLRIIGNLPATILARKAELFLSPVEFLRSEQPFYGLQISWRVSRNSD